MSVRLTHIGGPTVLIEVGGWRLLTDPTFDPPGQKYNFSWGGSSRKLVGPAIAASDLPPIDAVLTAIPIHYEGWKHFKQGRSAIEDEFARASDEIRRSVQWVPIGSAVELAV